MSGFETVSDQACFGGRQQTLSHRSKVLGCDMRLSVFLPQEAAKGARPVVWFLSGLTCTEQNVATKSGLQRYAAEHGLVVICPDTSPRGLGYEGEDDAWDFGTGAGFYVDATEAPWNGGYKMYSYVTDELLNAAQAHLPIDTDAMGITGHSMGGHGALVIGLRNPERYRAISAFSPIVNPTDVPWGNKAFSNYLGPNQDDWAAYDAVRLIEGGARSGEILVDQGAADNFLEEQLQPQRLRAACEDADQPLTLRMQEGYDHSYYFVSTFIGEHLAFFAERLK